MIKYIIFKIENDLITFIGETYILDKLYLSGVLKKEYAVEVNNLNEKEIEAIYQAYKSGKLISEDLIDFVCKRKGLKYASTIRFIGYTLDVFDTKGELLYSNALNDYDFSIEDEEIEEAEWNEYFRDLGFDALSAERIADKIMSLYR